VEDFFSFPLSPAIDLPEPEIGKSLLPGVVVVVAVGEKARSDACAISVERSIALDVVAPEPLSLAELSLALDEPAVGVVLAVPVVVVDFALIIEARAWEIKVVRAVPLAAVAAASAPVVKAEAEVSAVVMAEGVEP
jgi:hypothetical protein